MSKEGYLDTGVYHCQQAVEKMIVQVTWGVERSQQLTEEVRVLEVS